MYWHETAAEQRVSMGPETVGPLARGLMTTYQAHQEYLQRVEQVG